MILEKVFPPLDIFNKIQEQNEELGLIIELTYTYRYYKPELHRKDSWEAPLKWHQVLMPHTRVCIALASVNGSIQQIFPLAQLMAVFR